MRRTTKCFAVAIAMHAYCACATSDAIEIATHEADVEDAAATHDAYHESSYSFDASSDDGNGDDPLDAEVEAEADVATGPPPVQSIVFVSSKVYAGGSLAGLAGADAICQSLASAASLGTASTFKAWLSDASTAADSRFSHWSTPYVLADLTTQVAGDWATLTSGTLSHPIDLTESLGSPPTGTMASGTVWTNTSSSGSKYSSTDCSNWTSTKATVSSFHFGQATASTSAWTLDPSGSYTGNFCGDTAAIYCIGE